MMLETLLPRTAGEVSALMRELSPRRTGVEPAGAGTWLRRDQDALVNRAIVSTAKMDEIFEYEPEDLTASFGAGTTLEAVRSTVAGNRQMLALDPPALEGATIGAVAALGSAGPLRLLYGTPRDQVLGLELVTGDGRLLRVGGRVVKNVAGYDLTRLVVGSQGTLGIITRVNVRLRPLPQHDRTWQIEAKEPAPLLEQASALRSAAFEPAAVELLGPHDKIASWRLLVRVHGNAQTIEAAGAQLSSAATELDIRSAERVWHELSHGEAVASFHARLGALYTRVAELVDRARAIARETDGARVAAHVHDGIVRVFSAAPPDVDVVPALRTLRDELSTIGGTLTLPALPSSFARALPAHAPIGEGEAKLMRGVKRMFDPEGVLSPGRLLA